MDGRPTGGQSSGLKHWPYLLERGNLVSAATIPGWPKAITENNATVQTLPRAELMSFLRLQCTPLTRVTPVTSVPSVAWFP